MSGALPDLCVINSPPALQRHLYTRGNRCYRGVLELQSGFGWPAKSIVSEGSSLCPCVSEGSSLCPLRKRSLQPLPPEMGPRNTRKDAKKSRGSHRGHGGHRGNIKFVRTRPASHAHEAKNSRSLGVENSRSGSAGGCPVDSAVWMCNDGARPYRRSAERAERRTPNA